MNEDKKLLSDADEILAMTQSRGWALVKSKLDEYILDLQNINNIDTSSPDTMTQDIRARIIASKLLFEWLKGNVYGVIEQQRASHESVIENPANDFIVRNPEGGG